MDVIEIVLTQGKVTIVDKCDLELVRQYTWSANIYGRDRKCRGYWYAQTNQKQSDGSYKHLKLHRLIMNAKPGQLVDHINHDTLDNRRSNLRFATPGKNQFNARAIRGGASKYKGVTLYRTGRWVASIRKNGKLQQIGTFQHEEDAAVAYDRAALRLFGEFACTNFPSRILEQLP